MTCFPHCCTAKAELCSFWMAHTLRKTVRGQRSGRVEIVSPELREGMEAEVILILPEPNATADSIVGSLADQADLLDEIVEEAMRANSAVRCE